MYYTDTTAEELTKLRDGLEILERVGRDTGADQLKIYLYGLTTDPGILAAAKEAIAAEGDEPSLTEDDIELGEVAVELQLSADILYYLLGSGLKLSKRDEFSYQGPEGEGIRQVSFNWTHQPPTVSVGSFSRMAVSGDYGWGDKFLAQYGQKVPMKKNVQRTQPATPAAASAPVPKQTSVLGGKQLEDLLEGFLG